MGLHGGADQCLVQQQQQWQVNGMMRLLSVAMWRVGLRYTYRRLFACRVGSGRSTRCVYWLPACVSGGRTGPLRAVKQRLGVTSSTARRQTLSSTCTHHSLTASSPQVRCPGVNAASPLRVYNLLT